MKRRSAGFTIIELMIATSVFTVVLLVLSVAILQLGRIYYKGITSSQTQDAAQSLMDSIAQAIQLSPGQVAAPNNDTAYLGTNPDSAGNFMICAGTQQFSYRLGQQVNGNNHGVVRFAGGGNCAGSAPLNMAAALPAGATELLGHNMRLASLSVTPASTTNLNSYKITVRVVYGDPDLLCTTAMTDATDPASCDNKSAMDESEITGWSKAAVAVDNDKNHVYLAGLRCKNVSSGGQFCAEAELSTIVERRVNQ